MANRLSSGQQAKMRWPGSLREWHPWIWMPLGHSEIHCIGCRPDQPGASRSGQLLLVRYMTSADATWVKATALPTPGKQWEKEFSLLLYIKSYIISLILLFGQSLQFAIWALIENLSTPMLETTYFTTT